MATLSFTMDKLFGIIAIITSLFASGIVNCAPTGIVTSTESRSSTTEPSQSTATLSIVSTILLGSPRSSTAPTTTEPPAETFDFYRMLSTLISTLRTRHRVVFNEYTESRMKDYVLIPLNGLPDMLVLNELDARNMSEADVVGTHYTFLSAFERVMNAIIDDEDKYNGSHLYLNQFTGVKQRMELVIQGTRQMMDSWNVDDNSTASPVYEFSFPQPSTATMRTLRDISALNVINEYLSKLDNDFRILRFRHPRV